MRYSAEVWTQRMQWRVSRGLSCSMHPGAGLPEGPPVVQGPPSVALVLWHPVSVGQRRRWHHPL
eukprot:6781108-Pyramimonas_sp.AAC.1